ncbi:MAG TPA: hypothetical protein VGK48_13575 [Terriglobia bacterium]|jgi:Ca-activated chloride channel family protein
MVHRKAAIVFTILLGGILAEVLPAAQQTDRTVFVPVNVIGDANAAVTGLKPENFQLFEDNKEQKITSFSPENAPLSVSIILGAGAMVRSDRVSEKIMESVDAFKKTGNRANEYFVDPYPSTGVEDAIARGLDKLAGAKNRRKVLVMFIDNFDTPANPEQGALESAMKQDIPIYFMFIKNQFFRFSGTPTTAEDTGAYPISWMNVFENVASDTGGRVINAEPMGNLQDESVKLADELKNQYVLGFTPSSDARTDKWRNLKVTVKGVSGQQKAVVRFKKRYFAFR